MSITGSIFDIRRFCVHDGPGIRTTVFLRGCPLNCCWCHNPEGRRFDDNGDSEVSVESVIEEVRKDEPFYEESSGGVTFSGGEPLSQPRFLEALLRTCNGFGIHTTVDTCGYAPYEEFERIYPFVGLFLFDLKLMDRAEHVARTGVSNEGVLGNLKRLAESGDKVWIRIPLIPGITDTADNLEQIAEFMKPLRSIRRVSLLPYNRLGEDKIVRLRLARPVLDLEPQTAEDLEAKVSMFRALGYEVKVGG